MRSLPERENGLYRTAFDLSWGSPEGLAVVTLGLTTMSRKIGGFEIETECEMKHRIEDRLVVRFWVKILFGGVLVFSAWQSRLIREEEPMAAGVAAFIAGPWEEDLASLWRSERPVS